MAAYAPYTVVSGKDPDQLSHAINHMAQFGYQPIPGGFVDRGAKGVWCTMEMVSEEQAHASSEDAANARLAEAQAQAERIVAEAQTEAEQIRQHGPAGVRPVVQEPPKPQIAPQNRPTFSRDPSAADQPPPPPPPAPKAEPEPKPQGVSLDQILRPGAGGGPQPEPHG